MSMMPIEALADVYLFGVDKDITSMFNDISMCKYSMEFLSDLEDISVRMLQGLMRVLECGGRDFTDLFPHGTQDALLNIPYNMTWKHKVACDYLFGAAPDDLGDLILELMERLGMDALRQLLVIREAAWNAAHNAIMEVA